MTGFPAWHERVTLSPLAGSALGAKIYFAMSGETSDRSRQSQANSTPVEGESSPVTGIIPGPHRASPRIAAGLRGSRRRATAFASPDSVQLRWFFAGGEKDLLSVFGVESLVGNERAESRGWQTRTPIAPPWQLRPVPLFHR